MRIHLDLLMLSVLALASPVVAAPPIPQEAKEGLRRLYTGEPDAAIDIFRGMQRAQPQHPFGYLLEANARWWKMYCEACEIKWNLIDAWKRERAPGDDEYLALADNAIRLAEAQLKRTPAAEMHFYAGMGLALKARLHALRDERRPTARAGVKAREHLLAALRLDPQLADAYLGLGLYNYYVDSLPGIVKMLRFFMGIPGGSKKEGLAQLEKAIATGQWTQAEARFYLAKNLRNFEEKYAQAIEIITPMVEQYPRNPLFHLLLADFHAKLNHRDEATASFRTALQLVNNQSTPCAARIRKVASAALASLSKKS